LTSPETNLYNLTADREKEEGDKAKIDALTFLEKSVAIACFEERHPASRLK
jgi:hypothetical protein